MIRNKLTMPFSNKFIKNTKGNITIEFLFASVILIGILFFIADFTRLRLEISKVNQTAYTIARIISNRSTYFQRGTYHQNVIYQVGEADIEKIYDQQNKSLIKTRAPEIWDLASLSKFATYDSSIKFPFIAPDKERRNFCSEPWSVKNQQRFDCLMRGYNRESKYGFRVSGVGNVRPKNKEPDYNLLEEVANLAGLMLTNNVKGNPRVYLEESFGVKCSSEYQSDSSLYMKQGETYTYDKYVNYCGGGIAIDENRKQYYLNRKALPKKDEQHDFLNYLGPKIAPYSEWLPKYMVKENRPYGEYFIFKEAAPRKIPVYRVTICIPKPRGFFLNFFSFGSDYIFQNDLCGSAITVAR